MLVKLRPCPFCGGKLELETDDDGYGMVWGEHDDDCPMSIPDVSDHWYAPHQVNDAIEAWNRRVRETPRSKGE